MDTEGIDLARAALRKLDAAESRIAAALACHFRTRGITKDWCACGELWDIDADRCTSPTVAALLGDAG